MFEELLNMAFVKSNTQVIDAQIDLAPWALSEAEEWRRGTSRVGKMKIAVV